MFTNGYSNQIYEDIYQVKSLNTSKKVHEELIFSFDAGILLGGDNIFVPLPLLTSLCFSLPLLSRFWTLCGVCPCRVPIWPAHLAVPRHRASSFCKQIIVPCCQKVMQQTECTYRIVSNKSTCSKKGTHIVYSENICFFINSVTEKSANNTFVAM